MRHITCYKLILLENAYYYSKCILTNDCLQAVIHLNNFMAVFWNRSMNFVDIMYHNNKSADINALECLSADL